MGFAVISKAHLIRSGTYPVVQNEEIYYIDFECNEYMDEWNSENWGIKYLSKTPDMW